MVEAASRPTEAFARRGLRLPLAAMGLATLAALVACGGDDDDGAPASDLPATSAAPSGASQPAAPTATATPVILSLSGSGAKEQSIELASGVWVATITHAGRSNVIVKVTDAGARSQLLVNKVGAYQGLRPVRSTGAKYTLDIKADGAWTVKFTPDTAGEEAAKSFSGTGDSVSQLFTAPRASGTYAFTHTGKSNFSVRIDCGVRDRLVMNAVGVVDGTATVTFDLSAGKCHWDVVADGAWSITAK